MSTYFFSLFTLYQSFFSTSYIVLYFPLSLTSYPPSFSTSFSSSTSLFSLLTLFWPSLSFLLLFSICLHSYTSFLPFFFPLSLLTYIISDFSFTPLFVFTFLSLSDFFFSLHFLTLFFYSPYSNSTYSSSSSNFFLLFYFFSILFLNFPFHSLSNLLYFHFHSP